MLDINKPVYILKNSEIPPSSTFPIKPYILPAITDTKRCFWKVMDNINDTIYIKMIDSLKKTITVQ